MDSSLLNRPQSHPRWSPPPVGYLKLNFDRSAIGSLGLACVGGVIRDVGGSSIMSFSSTVWHCELEFKRHII